MHACFNATGGAGGGGRHARVCGEGMPLACFPPSRMCIFTSRPVTFHCGSGAACSWPRAVAALLSRSFAAIRACVFAALQAGRQGGVARSPAPVASRRGDPTRSPRPPTRIPRQTETAWAVGGDLHPGLGRHTRRPRLLLADLACYWPISASLKRGSSLLHPFRGTWSFSLQEE